MATPREENTAAIRGGELAAALQDRDRKRRWNVLGAVVAAIIIVRVADWIFGLVGAVTGAAIASIIGIDHLLKTREETEAEYQRELRAIGRAPMPGE